MSAKTPFDGNLPLRGREVPLRTRHGRKIDFQQLHKSRSQRLRPIVEAFLHARFMLEMACKFAEELSEPPQALPSGWAAFLYL